MVLTIKNNIMTIKIYGSLAVLFFITACQNKNQTPENYYDFPVEDHEGKVTFRIPNGYENLNVLEFIEKLSASDDPNIDERIRLFQSRNAIMPPMIFCDSSNNTIFIHVDNEEFYLRKNFSPKIFNNIEYLLTSEERQLIEKEYVSKKLFRYAYTKHHYQKEQSNFYQYCALISLPEKTIYIIATSTTDQNFKEMIDYLLPY